MTMSHHELSLKCAHGPKLHTHTHIYIYTYMHTYTYTYIYIYIYIISHHELSLECAHGPKLWRSCREITPGVIEIDESYCTTTRIPILGLIGLTPNILHDYKNTNHSEILILILGLTRFRELPPRVVELDGTYCNNNHNKMLILILIMTMSHHKFSPECAHGPQL